MAELASGGCRLSGRRREGNRPRGCPARFAEHGWTDWISVAGTSAGSIIAAYLACGHGPDDLEKLLRETPYEKFQDWGPGGKVIGGGLNLVRHHGLAHGEYFHKWFLEQTEEKTFGDVKKVRPDAQADRVRRGQQGVCSSSPTTSSSIANPAAPIRSIRTRTGLPTQPG